MNRALVVVAAALAACSSDRSLLDDVRVDEVDEIDEIEIPARPIEHRLTCGDVTAIWRGERIDGRYDHYDSLWLEPAGRAAVRISADDESELDSFDIFSPGGKHVLVPTSRWGPYHIVATSRIAAYLDGAKPDHVLAGERDPDSISGTGVFHDGKWISNDEVSYQWGCCDPPVLTRYRLDGTSSSTLAPSNRL